MFRSDFSARTLTFVTPGLDPGVHLFRIESLRRRWIAGSSPAMTGESASISSESGLAPVILFQIVGDDTGIGRIDRRPENIDHLGDLGVPQRRIGERRVHHDVIEAVAGGANWPRPCRGPPP